MFLAKKHFFIHSMSTDPCSKQNFTCIDLERIMDSAKAKWEQCLAIKYATQVQLLAARQRCTFTASVLNLGLELQQNKINLKVCKNFLLFHGKMTPEPEMYRGKKFKAKLISFWAYKSALKTSSQLKGNVHMLLIFYLRCLRRGSITTNKLLSYFRIFRRTCQQ